MVLENGDPVGRILGRNRTCGFWYVFILVAEGDGPIERRLCGEGKGLAHDVTAAKGQRGAPRAVFLPHGAAPPQIPAVTSFSPPLPSFLLAIQSQPQGNQLRS